MLGLALCVLGLLRIPTNSANFEMVMWICVAPAIPMVATIMPMSIIFVFLPFHAWFSFLKVVLTGGKSFPQSCFFIPCAPQSILEMDQAFALLAGLATLVGLEIAPPIVKSWSKNLREKRLFEKNVNKRIGMGINERERVSSGFEKKNASRTNSELEKLSRRTNSSIVGQAV